MIYLVSAAVYLFAVGAYGAGYLVASAAMGIAKEVGARVPPLLKK